MESTYGSDAFDGALSYIAIGNGASPEVFTKVSNITKISMPSGTTADIETTHLLSPEYHAEHIPGKRDSGEIGLEGWYVPTEDSQNSSAPSGSLPGGLAYLWRHRTVFNCKVFLFPTQGSPGVEIAVEGYVSKYQPGDLELGTAVKFTAAIKPVQSLDLP